jgi:hypothetical protein
VGGGSDISPVNTLGSANVGPPERQIVLPATLPQTTGYSVNGFNVSGARDGELAVGLSVAAIDQFKVQQNFLMPDQGAATAAVNVVTKTGGNQFHGEAFEFLRNRDLDARSFFEPAGMGPRLRSRFRSDYGPGSLRRSGPNGSEGFRD